MALHHHLTLKIDLYDDCFQQLVQKKNLHSIAWNNNYLFTRYLHQPTTQSTDTHIYAMNEIEDYFVNIKIKVIRK